VTNLSLSSNETVMAGLAPAIHGLALGATDVDARVRRQVYALCASQTAMLGHDAADRLAA